ncbi:cytochrome c oxidase subunit 3 [Piscinibacter sakaiensis]|uniref:Cytochrome c oxidase, polypeptide III n=1 Tax=Piscinibacter sakaiensis TaxID=1547922 RepID=A0A0K8P0L0_PISS1|nr:cytochrome c oxidase subunit 3 [Piscinibacter sakaiensis]GAP36158.1 cytochrome c oxidase, polypeptide III [Piscinibacter sakaiensis]
MSREPTLVSVQDVGSWSRMAGDRRHPLWWGILGLMAVEGMVVASLIAGHLYLAALTPDWPPAGAGPLPLLLPTIDLGLLAASALAMFASTVAINRGRRGATLWTLALALVLDAAVLVLRWLQLEALPFRWDDHAYGSLVWTMTGFHFMHVASAVLGTAVVWWLAWVGHWTRERQLGSNIDAMYWYFVSALWVPLYAAIYLTPRVLG